MKSRHDKQDLLERLLKDNGGTGLASHIEHKTPKVFNSVAETFLQGVMAFPKDEKLGNEYSYQYFTEPSSSSSSNSVSSDSLGNTNVASWTLDPRIVEKFMKHFHTFPKSHNEEFLPLIKYLIENKNTTVYQYRIGGHVLVSIDRIPVNYKFAEAFETAKLTASTDGVEVKQTEAEIYWSGIDTVPVLLDPVLTSNGTHPNSIPGALREAALNGSTRPNILKNNLHLQTIPGRTLRRPDTIVNDRKWQRILPFCNVSDRKAP
ncbi:unnamed protein product, partial [Rotaria magnacalcarata]